MNNKVAVTWAGEMSFEAEVNGFKMMMDADEKVGGQNKGCLLYTSDAADE